MSKKKAPSSTGNNNLLISQAQLNALSLGYDFENRCIYLFGPIDKSATYRFVAGFKWMDRSQGPIHVVLCSEGGDADAGFAIYEALRTARNPVVIEASGIVASAAVPVLLAGSVRFINPETKVMIHNLSYDINGTIGTQVIKSLSREAEEFNRRYQEIIAGRTGKSVKDVEKWCDNETFFSAQEAVKLGFADKIIQTRDLPKGFNEGLREVQDSLDEDTLNAISEEVDAAKKRKKKAVRAKKAAKKK